MPFHALCVGLSEEGFFRGYVQTHLEKSYGASRAILIQAVLFGIWHFVWDLNPFDLWGMVQYMALAFLIGLPFGYFYSKARNLAPVIITHALWNSVQMGIIANPAASEALQSIPMATQILILLLPYAISVTAAILFTKLVEKEI
jgi:membrane protease YdiL (CAAX protease family)